MKKLTGSDLRRLVLKEIKSTQTLQTNRNRNRTLAALFPTLFEHTVPGAGADINDMDASAVWDIMTGDDSEAAVEFLSNVGSATKWGKGALGKAGIKDQESLKKAAEEIWGDKKTFVDRVSGLVKKLGSAEGFSKPEMPALEGGDVDIVADALGEPGELNIDIGSDYGGGTADFEKYAAKELEKEIGKGIEKEKKNESALLNNNVLFERWERLAGLNEIKDDPRFPFKGAGKVMPGAPNLGDEGKPDAGAISGEAEAFLKKGKGNKGDDLSVKKGASMKNSEMIPTQKNVKAAKSLLFALLNIGEDMGGAFASSEGEIIDGHHRWSGQWLRSGGDATMTDVNIIDKGGMGTEEFLTMLTVLGQAIGRPTKLK